MKSKIVNLQEGQIIILSGSPILVMFDENAGMNELYDVCQDEVGLWLREFNNSNARLFQCPKEYESICYKAINKILNEE